MYTMRMSHIYDADSTWTAFFFIILKIKLLKQLNYMFMFEVVSKNVMLYTPFMDRQVIKVYK